MYFSDMHVQNLMAMLKSQNKNTDFFISLASFSHCVALTHLHYSVILILSVYFYHVNTDRISNLQKKITYVFPFGTFKL